jgi:hypothetical protein
MIFGFLRALCVSAVNLPKTLIFYDKIVAFFTLISRWVHSPITPPCHNRYNLTTQLQGKEPIPMRSNILMYQSYLLRLWRESNDGDWRASLQNIATGKCVNFSSMAALCAHLEDCANEPQRAWEEITTSDGL